MVFCLLISISYFPVLVIFTSLSTLPVYVEELGGSPSYKPKMGERRICWVRSPGRHSLVILDVILVHASKKLTNCKHGSGITVGQVLFPTSSLNVPVQVVYGMFLFIGIVTAPAVSFWWAWQDTQHPDPLAGCTCVCSGPETSRD